MTLAEWINLGYFSFFVAFAFLYPLPPSRRLRALGMGLAGIILLFTPQLLLEILPSSFSGVLRDWMPLALMLIAYWLPGNFFVNPNEELSRKLQRIDSKILERILRIQQMSGGSFMTYLELAYLFCYPFVPLGFGVYYALEPGASMDNFWVPVLVPSYICYALLPFTQTLPPWRLLEEDRHSGLIRRLNFFIVRRASTQANTFPSAHVAASLAVSLVLLTRQIPIGLLFLIVALSIAVSAFAGRYHYAVDVVTGALLAIAVFLAFLITRPAILPLLS
jgi:membrane-associated phospholipid phosphatase